MKEYKIILSKDSEIKTLYYINSKLMCESITYFINRGWKLENIKEV